MKTTCPIHILKEERPRAPLDNAHVQTPDHLAFAKAMSGLLRRNSRPAFFLVLSLLLKEAFLLFSNRRFSGFFVDLFRTRNHWRFLKYARTKQWLPSRRFWSRRCGENQFGPQIYPWHLQRLLYPNHWRYLQKGEWSALLLLKIHAKIRHNGSSEKENLFKYSTIPLIKEPSIRMIFLKMILIIKP